MNNDKYCVLIVDDDTAHRNMLKLILSGWNYETQECADGQDAVELVKIKGIDLVLTDVRMAHMDGITALSIIHQWDPNLPVIVMTAYSSLEKAVEATKIGAYSYLSKPLDFESLKLNIANALEHSALRSENEKLKQALGDKNLIIGTSGKIRDLMTMIHTIAPTEATVLIMGESGTGKELVALSIQKNSKRGDKPFVTLNCAALTESLLESELFGHEKGAFTGADKKRDGRFMQAHTGTIFLDEIGEMPLSLQAKLLRVLQEGEVQRLGSDVPLTVDVRVITATNRDLEEEVKNGRFREDLYYRLNVISVEVPPLSERMEDIPLLTTFFLDKFNKENRKNIQGFTQESMRILNAYHWPGNVRELQNVVERAVILTSGDFIDERSFPSTLQENHSKDLEENKSAILTLKGLSLEELERQAITVTLTETDDNKSEAARLLGITRATLHNKLKKYRLE